MKDTEFIELLNLYLDHEITAADAARLEAEVQNNTQRRQIYRQYCRMQKACRMIAADFETESDNAAAAGERKIIAFNPAVAEAVALRRKRRIAVYSAGSFAALAACVALVFVGGNGTATAPTPADSAAAPIAAAVPSAIDDPDATFVPSKSAAPRGLVSLAPRPQQRLMRDPLLLTSHTRPGAVLDSGSDETAHQLAWIHSVQLSPMPAHTPADLQFTATLATEGRALGGRRAAPAKEPADEYLGFQFRK